MRRCKRGLDCKEPARKGFWQALKEWVFPDLFGIPAALAAGTVKHNIVRRLFCNHDKTF